MTDFGPPLKTLGDAHGWEIYWGEKLLRLSVPKEFHEDTYDAELLHPDFCDWYVEV